MSQLRIRHTVYEYWDQDHWCWPMQLCTQEQFKLLRSIKTDMAITLMIYKGVRLRDLKASYEHTTNNNLDSQLEQMQMKDITTLLVILWEDISYQIDMDKEEVFAFASDAALMKYGGKTSHVQSLVYATSDKDKNNSRPKNLIPIELKRVFMEGFMDVANGVPMQDPRVPMQDLGVAAEKARKEALKKKKMFTKKSYEEQVADAKKRAEKQKQKHLNQVTAESTEPVEESKTGCIDDFFNSIEPVPETVEIEKSTINNPSQLRSSSFYRKYEVDLPPQPSEAPSTSSTNATVASPSIQIAESGDSIKTVTCSTSFDFMDIPRKGYRGRGLTRRRDDDEESTISTTSTMKSNTTYTSQSLINKWGTAAACGYRLKGTVGTPTSSSAAYPNQVSQWKPREAKETLSKAEDPEDEDDWK